MKKRKVRVKESTSGAIRTYEEVAKMLDPPVTPQRVRQIEQRAFAKLRILLQRKGIMSGEG